MEVGRFRFMKMDGNGDSVSVHFCQAHFPFSVSPPNVPAAASTYGALIYKDSVDLFPIPQHDIAPVLSSLSSPTIAHHSLLNECTWLYIVLIINWWVLRT